MRSLPPILVRSMLAALATVLATAAVVGPAFAAPSAYRTPYLRCFTIKKSLPSQIKVEVARVPGSSMSADAFEVTVHRFNRGQGPTPKTTTHFAIGHANESRLGTIELLEPSSGTLQITHCTTDDCGGLIGTLQLDDVAANEMICHAASPSRE